MAATKARGASVTEREYCVLFGVKISFSRIIIHICRLSRRIIDPNRNISCGLIPLWKSRSSVVVLIYLGVEHKRQEGTVRRVHPPSHSSHKATIYGLISVIGRSCTSSDCICCLSSPSSYLDVRVASYLGIYPWAKRVFLCAVSKKAGRSSPPTAISRRCKRLNTRNNGANGEGPWFGVC